MSILMFWPSLFAIVENENKKINKNGIQTRSVTLDEDQMKQNYSQDKITIASPAASTNDQASSSARSNQVH